MSAHACTCLYVCTCLHKCICLHAHTATCTHPRPQRRRLPERRWGADYLPILQKKSLSGGTGSLFFHKRVVSLWRLSLQCGVGDSTPGAETWRGPRRTRGHMCALRESERHRQELVQGPGSRSGPAPSQRQRALAALPNDVPADLGGSWDPKCTRGACSPGRPS